MKIYKSRFSILLFSIFIANILFAQNPIIKDIGMSDPHVRVFNDTVFLYSGHDNHPDDKLWDMKDWRIFSTVDLCDWKQVGTISPKENYMDDNSISCWASDAAERNGKYYFYFSDRKESVGVMVADSPSGPFIDPNGKPLVAPMHDPTILIDDDLNKTPYLIYGDKAGDGFHIAKLNEDMISTVEEPKGIEIIGEEWERAPEWMDKNYLFKNKDTYYLSWGRDYAVSKNIYGPYKCVGSVGNGHELNEFAHGSFFEWKGQFYHIWCYYIKPGFKYRECIISYCHMDDNGKIVTDTKFLDEHFENGVGQYNASWTKIEAEWFYEKSQNVKKKGSIGDFKMTNFKDGSWLKFSNVTFNGSKEWFEAAVNSASGKGKLEIRLDDANGEIIGELAITSKNTVQNFRSKIKSVKGKRDVYLKFIGDNSENVELDWFRFE